MTTQTIAARTAEQYLENEGWPKAALAVERARQNAAGFLGKVVKTLQSVFVELRPLQQSFRPTYWMARRHSNHCWPTEQASIDSFLMGQ
jgi:hypothetical protein